VTTNLSTPTRALAVGAHPDDIEFGCGGTLAKWASQGCAVYLAVCTDGSKGSWNAFEDQVQLINTRQKEQQAAASVLGVEADVVFLGWSDGELEAGKEQRRRIARLIRETTPDVVLGHDPWKRYRLHPDHRNAGFLVTDGIVAARDPLFFPELDVEPHRPGAILLFEADAPDHVEDIAATFDLKLEALLEHRSQLLSTMAIPTGAERSDPAVAAFSERVRLEAATAARGTRFSLGEAFKRIEA